MVNDMLVTEGGLGGHTPPVAGGRACCTTSGVMEHTIGERSQVCRYTIALRARACARRTGVLVDSGYAVLRRSGDRVPLLAGFNGGISSTIGS